MFYHGVGKFIRHSDSAKIRQRVQKRSEEFDSAYKRKGDRLNGRSTACLTSSGSPCGQPVQILPFSLLLVGTSGLNTKFYWGWLLLGTNLIRMGRMKFVSLA